MTLELETWRFTFKVEFTIRCLTWKCQNLELFDEFVFFPLLLE